MLCPKCRKEMVNLGNISMMVTASNPPQWDEVYVCNKDKVKKTVRARGEIPADYSYVAGFEELEPIL